MKLTHIFQTRRQAGLLHEPVGRARLSSARRLGVRTVRGALGTDAPYQPQTGNAPGTRPSGRSNVRLQPALQKDPAFPALSTPLRRERRAPLSVALWVAGLLLALLLPSTARAALNVVTTTPEFAAIAHEVGGDFIKVTSLAKGTEDPHFVDPRPSFIRVLNQADALVEGGAELEIGWLPPLVDNARNTRILTGAPGRIVMTRGIRLLEAPEGVIDRSLGDVHAAGNPHYTLDPANGKLMAATLAEAFSQLDPGHAAKFAAQLARFTERLDQKLAAWAALMEPWRGTKVLTYHKSYEYFAARFGLEIVGQIEPKPGIEPSPTHINSLITTLKTQGVKLVLMEPNRSRKTPEFVANAIGAKVVVLPILVGGADKATDYFALFDYNLGEVIAALKALR